LDEIISDWEQDLGTINYTREGFSPVGILKVEGYLKEEKFKTLLADHDIDDIEWGGTWILTDTNAEFTTDETTIEETSTTTKEEDDTTPTTNSSTSSGFTFYLLFVGLVVIIPIRRFLRRD
ncbi:unnamed protein product, partial [marine sediment metagenome]